MQVLVLLVLYVICKDVFLVSILLRVVKINI